jgi:hypothetical protein
VPLLFPDTGSDAVEKPPELLLEEFDVALVEPAAVLVLLEFAARAIAPVAARPAAATAAATTGPRRWTRRWVANGSTVTVDLPVLVADVSAGRDAAAGRTGPAPVSWTGAGPVVRT